jgi:transcriptional/translational regulatory protein YebC/TACO1
MTVYIRQLLYRAKGGADMETNAKLKTVILQARGAGVPSDIIDRNLKKAADKSAVWAWGLWLYYGLLDRQ